MSFCHNQPNAPTGSSGKLGYSALLLAAVSQLCGCLTHTYYTPGVDGIITQNGKPLEGAIVWLSNSADEKQKMQTNKNGHFAFSAEGGWILFVPIGPQDRMTSWSINIYQPSGALEIYSEYGLAGIFSGYSYGDHVSLRCDIPNLNAAKRNTRTSPSVCQRAP